jgi:hypothetical protein
MDLDLVMTVSVVVAVLMFVLRQVVDIKANLPKNGKDPTLAALHRIEERIIHTLDGHDVRIRAAESYIASSEAQVQAFWKTQWTHNERIELRVDQLEGKCAPFNKRATSRL